MWNLAIQLFTLFFSVYAVLGIDQWIKARNRRKNLLFFFKAECESFADQIKHSYVAKYTGSNDGKVMYQSKYFAQFKDYCLNEFTFNNSLLINLLIQYLDSLESTINKQTNNHPDKFFRLHSVYVVLHLIDLALLHKFFNILQYNFTYKLLERDIPAIKILAHNNAENSINEFMEFNRLIQEEEEKQIKKNLLSKDI